MIIDSEGKGYPPDDRGGYCIIGVEIMKGALTVCRSMPSDNAHPGREK
jgi:hypothetical protein